MRIALGLVLSFLAPNLHALDADDAFWRVPFIGTPDEVVLRMLELAGTRADDLVVDLGSGDGRIVIMAARKFGARGLGIEREADLIREALDNARRANVTERVSFVRGDVLEADISRATVVTVYLLPQLVERLQLRFYSELAPGTRIVAHAFGLSGWPPDREETVQLQRSYQYQGSESRIYLWIVPARVRGTWVSGARRVTIEQNYQAIEVEGARRAKLSGRDIEWESAEGRFHGRAEEGRIAGELTGPGGTTALVYTRAR
jgi:precorrin-6B methylase 2